MDNHLEIVVTNSKARFFRAGVGLFVVPLAMILTTFGFLVFREGTHPDWSGVAGGAIGAFIGLFCFLAVAARITLENGVLRILRSMDEIVIPTNSIDSARMQTFPPSRWIVGAISVRGRKLPVFFHMTIMDRTNIGDFNATANAIRKALRTVGST